MALAASPCIEAPASAVRRLSQKSCGIAYFLRTGRGARIGVPPYVPAPRQGRGTETTRQWISL
jgi:hypothetical protein